MKEGTAPKIVIILGIIILLGAGGAFLYYFTAQPTFEKTTQRVLQFTPQSADFPQAKDELERLLTQNPPKEEEAFARTMLGDMLLEIDRRRGTELLKDVARNQEFPAGLRTRALTYIAEHAELDFTDENFGREVIFTGPVFQDFLTEAKGNEWLAMRKLNEWSNEIFPNVVANYRIAQWYASEIHRDELSPDQEQSYRAKMKEYLDAGDQLFDRYRNELTPNRKGIAYQAKARALSLANENAELVEELFLLARKEYLTEPITVFQDLHLRHSDIFYAAFLAKNYGEPRLEDVEKLLNPFLFYFIGSGGGSRSLRSMLVAVRNSEISGYPFADFDKQDLERLKELYPEFGDIVDNLVL